MQRWSWDLSSSDREDLEEPFGECSQGLWPGVPRSSQGQCQSQDSHSSLSDEWQDTAMCFDATMKNKTKPNSPAVIDCTFQWCQNLFSGLMGMSMSPPSVVSNKWQVLSPHDEWHSEQGQDGQGAGSVSQAPAEWGAVKSHMTPPSESSGHGLVIPRPSGSAFIVQSRRDSSDTLRPSSLAPSTPMTSTSAGPYCLANPDPCLYPHTPNLGIWISGIPKVFTPSHLFSSLTPLCQVH